MEDGDSEDLDNSQSENDDEETKELEHPKTTPASQSKQIELSPDGIQRKTNRKNNLNQTQNEKSQKKFKNSPADNSDKFSSASYDSEHNESVHSSPAQFESLLNNTTKVPNMGRRC